MSDLTHETTTAEDVVAIAGGDTNAWDGPLVINVALLGEAGPRGPLTRGGPRAGDEIVVTGTFGGSRAGRQFDFQPRVREALRLVQDFEIHAGIDVSDGLSLDLSRVAEESRCGALLEVAAVPIDPAAEQLARQAADGSTRPGGNTAK